MAAIARPQLNADSTAASAIACQSVIAARGARIGHWARDNASGAGPTKTSVMMPKSSAVIECCPSGGLWCWVDQ
ncbi:Uncharacterised protein [Mycobacteroides abscessus subsp. abscessus]|nr:Uncharacterised protein [Mycobacteroides abscessus subsp. abscessus]